MSNHPSKQEAQLPTVSDAENAGTLPKWSRRKLLATLGAAGATLAASELLTGRSFAAPPTQDGVFESVYGSEANKIKVPQLTSFDYVLAVTLNDLRAETSPQATFRYYVTDAGKEGHFYYDPSDTTTPDNTGTVVVSASGARFKRILDQDALVVTWFGAAGDGITDDTGTIQQALNAVPPQGGTILIPNGTYLINAVQSLHPNNHTTLVLHPGAVLKAIPNANGTYHVINLIDKEHVLIQGGAIVGERNEHLGTTGEWGMGIGIRSSKYITIRDTVIRDCWGDGIYIGVNNSVTPHVNSEHVSLYNVTCDNNRRQGLSVTACKQGIALGCRFINTNGVEPQSGIDIEPNETVVAEHFVVAYCDCSDNAGSGIAIYGTTPDNARYNILEGNTCNRNRRGIQVRGASYNKVLYNVCSDNTDMGLRVGWNAKAPSNTNNDYIGNTLERNGTKGITVEGTATASINHNIFMQNRCKDNSQEGISMLHAQYCQVTDNQCTDNQFGIRLVGLTCSYNDVSRNICTGNRYGIQLWESSNNRITGNQVNNSGQAGIWLRRQSHNNQVLSNNCTANGQEGHNLYDNIVVMEGSTFNNMQLNTARKGSGAVRSRYGLYIDAADCTDTIATNNDLIQGGETASFLDNGTGTQTTAANRL